MAISTHKLDTSFAKVHCRTKPQKTRKLQAEQDTVQLWLTPPGSSRDDKVVSLARKLWADWFGEARASPTVPRLDKGVKRKAPAFCSEDKRQKYNIAARDPVDASELSESHTKELEWQRSKLGQRAVEHYECGLLMDHEVTDEIKAGVQEPYYRKSG